MDALPPPQVPAPDPGSPAASGRSRLTIVGVAAVAALAAGGALVAVSQFAGADAPSIATSTAVSPADDPPTGDPDDGADGVDGSDGADHWAGFDRCLEEQLGIDVAGGDEPGDGESGDGESSDKESAEDEFGDERFEAAEAACADLLPPDVKAELEAFEDFDQCLAEQLGDVFDVFDDAAWNGSVVVEQLGDDGETLSVHDFGPGDATVVVTKTGDTITVETTGDVTTFDASDLAAEHDAWEAAEQACADLLPEDLKIFDDWGDGLDELFEDVPIEELFEQLPIDELLEDIPLDELFEDIPPEELDIPLDELLEDIPLDELFEQLPIEELFDELPVGDLEELLGVDAPATVPSGDAD